MSDQSDCFIFLEVGVLEQRPISERYLRPVRNPLWASLGPADQFTAQLESFGYQRRWRFTAEPGKFLGGSGNLAAHLLEGC